MRTRIHAATTTTTARRGLLRGLTGGLLVLVLSGLPACGAGGAGGDGDDGGGSPPAAVAIQTGSLPSAGVGTPYSATLVATGGDAPYAWSVAGGSSLPPGLSLSPAGTLSGSATTLGAYTFSVVVTDSGSPAQTDSASYALTVSAFGASLSLLRFGEAWTGESYPVSAVGSPSTTFTLVQNQSGGSILAANPAASTATYRAGSSPGTDRIRATSTTGATADLDVVVQPNPVASMTASFSGSDVWHVRFAGKFDGTHPYASDFHWGLEALGLRATASTTSTGTTADQVAELLLRREILAATNLLFLRNADGSQGPNGLEITLPFDEPQAPHFAPGNGNVASPATNQFNVLSVISGGDPGVLGTAYLDSTDNDWQENDTTSAQGGTLGVFLDEMVPIFNAAYGNNTLPATPVNANDVAALKALLYGTAKPAGSRYDELSRIVKGFAKTIAGTIAHEIGHSLGLVHTSPTQAGSIMNAGAVISPSATYAFVAADVSLLRNALPGPGRGGSPQRIEALRVAGPDEGDPVGTPVVCGCRLHVRDGR